jgi:hypothetical protein
MQVIFESTDPQALQLRVQTQRRVRRTLKRLAWLAPRVRVRLSDVNGPCGGIDKRCQVEVFTDGGKPVVVTSIARDWMSALQGALSRVSRSLVHDLQRHLAQRRNTPAFAAP